jgi:hypothetical protein
MMMKKLLLAGMVVGLICGIGRAADRSDTSSLTGLVQDAVDAAFDTDTLVLDEKGEDGDYFLFCSRRLDVTSSTIIKNEWGRVISYDRVPIPCEALVSYYKKPKTLYRYVAVTIQVIGELREHPM